MTSFGDKELVALNDIATERQRQIEAEGWAPQHDDEHSDGSLADAAAAYALSGTGHYANAVEIWPWDRSWWKPKTRRADLVRAGALIVAEIERLDRASAIADTHPQGGDGTAPFMGGGGGGTAIAQRTDHDQPPFTYYAPSNRE